MIICFIGDSLTLGVGYETGLGWPGRLTNDLLKQGADVTGYNLGVRKDASVLIAKRWREEAERRRMEGREFRLVFSFGVADVFNGTAMEDFIAAAETLLVEAHVMAQVLVVGPTPVASPEKCARIKTLSEELARICSLHKIPFVETIDAMQGSPVYRQALINSDGAHPSSTGYAALAEHLAGDKQARKFLGLER